MDDQVDEIPFLYLMSTEPAWDGSLCMSYSMVLNEIRAKF